jgi:UDP-N-acetylmuramoylalanine--D-glutamate ligase
MKVTVLGIARSGLSAAKAAMRLGYDVFISDIGKPDNIYLKELEKLHISFETDGHSSSVYDSDLIVVSPGIPINAEVIKKAYSNGIEVIGEIEFAYRHLNVPLIAITGTNGKTTTTTLIYNMLKNSGINVLIGGNIAPGIPLSSFIGQDKNINFIVAEISTFQLETIKRFNPIISVLTNITPDHIDRHITMDRYIKLKMRIFENHSKNDISIFNDMDFNTRKYQFMIKGKVYRFSLRNRDIKGTYIKGGKIYFYDDETYNELFDVSDIKFIGKHNIENVLAASCATVLAGGNVESIRETIKSTNSIPHRLEYLGNVNGIHFYNNSMCTNPVAFKSSLESLSNKNIILIAGGREKDTGLGEMGKSIVEHTKYTVLIGELKDKLEKEIIKYGYKNYSKTDDFEEAVSIAFKHANKDEVILLSPGAASFDMFKNFEDRGDQFKNIFKRMKEDNES